MFRPGTRKTFLLLLLVLLLAGILLFVLKIVNRSSSVAEKLLPDIQVVGTEVTGISEEELRLLAAVTLKNRMPVGFEIDSIAYRIFIEDKEIGYSLHPEPVNITASGQSSIKLPVSIAYKKAGRLFESLHEAGKDSARMRMGILLYSNVIPKDSAWVQVKQNIPVIVLPVVRLEKLQVKDLTASGATLQLTMMALNDNTMDFAFRDSKYKVILEEHKALEGVIPQTLKLPAKDSVQLTVPVELNFKELGRTLADLIRKGTDLKYDVTVTTRPVTSVASFKNTDIILHAAGDLKTVKEAVDKK